MKLQDLNSLFIQQLKDIYGAEKKLVKALPKMAKAASHESLREAFQHHEEETQQQVHRLEEVFRELEISPRASRCRAMEGLIEEAEEVLKEKADPEVLDAALICAAQRVEHYEIAAYGCARSLAEQLGRSDLAEELQATLKEEKASNEKLNQLALHGINEEAMKSEQGEWQKEEMTAE
jgi:ferritin-like metal-binding protein YciE